MTPNGGFRKGGSRNGRFVLEPDIAIASEVSTFRSKNSLAITDLLAKKMQLVNSCKSPLPGTPPNLRFPTLIFEIRSWFLIRSYFRACREVRK